MPRTLPVTYNSRNDQLDPFETHIRDGLRVNVESWAKFRNLVGAGLNSNALKSKKGTKRNKNVNQLFREFGKAHYQTITNLGFCRQALIECIYYEKGNLFLFDKSLYSFKLARHWIDWTSGKREMLKLKVRGMNTLIRNKRIDQIINIRNNYAHNWCPVKTQDPRGTILWSNAVRTLRNYKWPYHQEAKRMGKAYIPNRRVIDDLDDDFRFLENFSMQIFEKLIAGLPTFEINHNVVLK